MRRLLLGLVLLLCALPAWSQTATVSGNLKTVGVTNATTPGTKVTFTLQNYASNIPRVSGSYVVAQASYNFTPDANGAISGSVIRNDQITPAGTYYQVCIYDAGRQFRCANYTIAAASFDLNSAAPITTSPVVTPPTGDTTYLRTDGGNQMAGNIIPNTTDTRTLGNSGARFDATLDDVVVGKVNSIRFVDGAKFTTIDAAANDIGANPGLVIVPSTYTGADMTVTNKNITVMDLRTAGVTRFYTGASDSAGSTGGQIFLRNDVVNTQPTVPNLENRLMAVQVGAGGTGIAVPVYGHVFWQGNVGGGTTQAHNGIYGEVQLFNITGWDAADAAIGGEFKGSVSGTANTAQPSAWGVFGQGQVVAGFDDTAAQLVGVRGGITTQATGAGTITDAMALFAAAFSQGGTTTFTNAYGLYVEPPGVGTNRWGIYSGGATTRNQIAGYLEIDGDTTVGGVANIGLSLTAGNAQVLHASSPQIRIQDATNSVVTKVQSLDTTGLVGTESNHALEIRTNNNAVATFDTTGNLLMEKKTTEYNNIATVSNGVPAEYATVNLTAQGAAIGATTLYAVPAAGAGQYRVCFNMKVTQAATTSSILGGTNGFQLVYTDQDDSVVVTTVAGLTFNSTVANLALNTTQAQTNGCLLVNAKASTNIQYQVDYTSVGATPMQFNLHIRLEAL